jgi:hypothetical protein
VRWLKPPLVSYLVGSIQGRRLILFFLSRSLFALSCSLTIQQTATLSFDPKLPPTQARLDRPLDQSAFRARLDLRRHLVRPRVRRILLVTPI